MELNDFTEKEQEQINQGLSTEISIGSCQKILHLYPKIGLWFLSSWEGMRRPRRLSKLQKQYPQPYAVAKQQGELPDKERGGIARHYDKHFWRKDE